MTFSRSCVRTKAQLIFSFVWAIIALFLVQVCSADKFSGCVTQRFPIYEDNQKNRRFIISEYGPSAQILRVRKDLQEKIAPMNSLLKNVVKIIDDRRRKHDVLQCNLDDKGWLYTADLSSRYLQIGKLNDFSHSQLDGAHAVSEGLLSRSDFHNSLDVIGDGVQALYETVSSIAESPQRQGLGNWTSSYPLRNWGVRGGMQQCRVETFSAYRQRNNFFLRASMTNHEVHRYVQDRHRQFVSEWIRDDGSQSLEMVHPSIKDMKLVKGSTLFEEWWGRAWISWHGQMQDFSSPAVQRAAEENEINVDLATDSIAPANIAIITLPLVMSFIPFSFLADLDTWRGLLYIILTDVISAVPFLIKGIELVRSSQSNLVLAVYYAGDEDLADIQIWAANCRGTDRFKIVGWILIVVGILAVIGGIALEILCKKYMDRKRNEDGVNVVGPFGKAMLASPGMETSSSCFDLMSARYSDESSEVDMKEFDVEEAKASDFHDSVSWDEKPGWIAAVLKRFLILSHDSPLQVWANSVDSQRMTSAEQAGVGHDGNASVER